MGQPFRNRKRSFILSILSINTRSIINICYASRFHSIWGYYGSDSLSFICSANARQKVVGNLIWKYKKMCVSAELFWTSSTIRRLVEAMQLFFDIGWTWPIGKMSLFFFNQKSKMCKRIREYCVSLHFHHFYKQ